MGFLTNLYRIKIEYNSGERVESGTMIVEKGWFVTWGMVMEQLKKKFQTNSVSIIDIRKIG